MRVFDVRRDRRATDDPTRARVRGRTRDDASSSDASDASDASVRASIANPPARAKRKQPADRLTGAPSIASHLASRTQDIRDKLKPTSSNRGRGGASSSGRPGRGRPRARPRVTERRDEDEDVVRAFFDRSQTLKWESGGDSRTGSIDRSISRCIWFFFRARAPAERGVSLCDWRFVNRRLHPSRGPSVQTETKVGGFETTVDCDFFSRTTREMWDGWTPAWVLCSPRPLPTNRDWSMVDRFSGGASVWWRAFDGLRTSERRNGGTRETDVSACVFYCDSSRRIRNARRR